MAIYATNDAPDRVLIPPGLYFARCYEIIEIGTVQEIIQNRAQIMHKVRIGWELPTELHSFKQGDPPQPFAIAKDFTLSLNQKANLRKLLASWRGQDFTEEEAKKFDITKVLGAPCFLNIIHKPSSREPGKMIQDIASVSPPPRGQASPGPANPIKRLEYDAWNQQVFDSLPDFIKNKMKTSLEYADLLQKGIIKPDVPQQYSQPQQYQPVYQQKQPPPPPQSNPWAGQPVQNGHQQPAYNAQADPQAWRPAEAVSNGQPLADLPF